MSYGDAVMMMSCDVMYNVCILNTVSVCFVLVQYVKCTHDFLTCTLYMKSLPDFFCSRQVVADTIIIISIIWIKPIIRIPCVSCVTLLFLLLNCVCDIKSLLPHFLTSCMDSEGQWRLPFLLLLFYGFAVISSCMCCWRKWFVCFSDTIAFDDPWPWSLIALLAAHACTYLDITCTWFVLLNWNSTPLFLDAGRKPSLKVDKGREIGLFYFSVNLTLWTAACLCNIVD